MATFFVISWEKYGNATKFRKVLLFPQHSSDSTSVAWPHPPLPPPFLPQASATFLWSLAQSHQPSAFQKQSLLFLLLFFLLLLLLPILSPTPHLSSSSGWSYLKLPALARLESDSSSAPSGFPECSWVAGKDFRLPGMGMGLQRKKRPLLPLCPLLLGGGLAVLCVSLGLLAVYLTL